MWCPDDESYAGCLAIPIVFAGAFAALSVWAGLYLWAVASGVVALAFVPLLHRDWKLGERVHRCEHNLRTCARVLRDYAREHGGEYPDPSEVASLFPGCECKPTCGSVGYEYRRPPPNAPSDVTVLRCMNHPTLRRPFRRNVTLELELNGTVRRH